MGPIEEDDLKRRIIQRNKLIEQCEDYMIEQAMVSPKLGETSNGRSVEVLDSDTDFKQSRLLNSFAQNILGS